MLPVKDSYLPTTPALPSQVHCTDIFHWGPGGSHASLSPARLGLHVFLLEKVSHTLTKPTTQPSLCTLGSLGGAGTGSQKEIGLLGPRKKGRRWERGACVTLAGPRQTPWWPRTGLPAPPVGAAEVPQGSPRPPGGDLLSHCFSPSSF